MTKKLSAIVTKEREWSVASVSRLMWQVRGRPRIKLSKTSGGPWSHTSTGIKTYTRPDIVVGAIPLIDFEDDARPQGGLADIGADERHK